MRAADQPAPEDVRFRSGDADCAAWLYLPDADGRAPVVVMGHGLGAVREMRLDAYAERFHAAGYACLVFDYRHLGASGGEPRQLVDVRSQLDDWAAALAYARGRPELDPDRVVIWGTSFGGGHAIAAAARDGRVAAAIAQCPFTDGIASLRVADPRSLAKVVPLALRDAVAAHSGRPPVLVRTAGPPGSAALMSAPDCEPGYLGIVPPGSTTFRNEVAARLALAVGRYRPGRLARRVRCPILFAVCERDSVAPAGATRRHAARAPRGEVRLYPYGHFEIYGGEPFERAVADQLAFLREHVPPAGEALSEPERGAARRA